MMSLISAEGIEEGRAEYERARLRVNRGGSPVDFAMVVNASMLLARAGDVTGTESDAESILAAIRDEPLGRRWCPCGRPLPTSPATPPWSGATSTRPGGCWPSSTTGTATSTSSRASGCTRCGRGSCWPPTTTRRAPAPRHAAARARRAGRRPGHAGLAPAGGDRAIQDRRRRAGEDPADRAGRAGQAVGVAAPTSAPRSGWRRGSSRTPRSAPTDWPRRWRCSGPPTTGSSTPRR